jgi:hypothetical protein
MVFRDLVLPNPREQHDRTAVGVRDLSERVLIGGRAERLIIAPDDHRNRGGAMTTQVMLDAERETLLAGRQASRSSSAAGASE